MKTVKIVIAGISPILINRFKENDEIPKTLAKSNKKDYGTPRLQAELTPYFDEATKLLWVPSAWLMGCIQAIASDYKLPGSRKSLKSISGGAIRPTEEKIYFLEKYKLKDIEVDSRPVVIQRARIMRHRARLEKWSLQFCLELENDLVTVDNLHQILNDAGRRAGLGDYRPQRSGPFGRFQIMSWEVCKD